jgi:hypothetical protein
MSLGDQCVIPLYWYHTAYNTVLYRIIPYYTRFFPRLPRAYDMYDTVFRYDTRAPRRAAVCYRI